MEQIFCRLEIIIGKEKMQKLLNSKIAIFGVGGVGGYVVESLARSGIGHIDLIDDDIVSYSNLNRQITALLSTIGMYKADVAKERILQINKDAKVRVFKTFYSPDTASQFDLASYDYVIDCIDTVKSKIDLILNAKKVNARIISSMGAGNKINPTHVEIVDIYATSHCPLSRVIRVALKKNQIKDLKVAFSSEIPIKRQIPEKSISGIEDFVLGSSAFVPASFGLAIASEVVRDLIKDALV